MTDWWGELPPLLYALKTKAKGAPANPGFVHSGHGGNGGQAETGEGAESRGLHKLPMREALLSLSSSFGNTQSLRKRPVEDMLAEEWAGPGRC